ncbi:MAG TPA: sterol desaturase family protein [Thermoanaerobaculia bacterium]|nr:sterol desaturase family protein [Thermoanaerobaculia bacterium]
MSGAGPGTREEHPLPTWVTALATGTTFLGLLWLERRRPLRRERESKGVRTARNLAVAGLSAATVQLAEAPVALPLARWTARRRYGLVQRLPLPAWARTALAVLLLDYTLYLWHVATHQVPFLWRFHKPHHADLDLDASTALRFHFGEMALSVPWRAAQVLLVGAGPRALTLWQTLVLVEILFHHSNVELSEPVDRRLSWLLVTPRMHGIHHSAVPEESDSNWSNLLTLWDRLHGTFRQDVPQEALRLGVPDHQDPAEVTLPRVLEMPFVEGSRDRYRFPGLSGHVPGKA